MTFSINIGTPASSTAYQLTGDTGTQSSFYYLLNKLEDNLIGTVKPIDLRNCIFSLNSSNIFKLTKPSNSNIDYIGIDTLNPANKDLKSKILIGKRGTGSNDIINDNLLSNNSDVYFYNTKKDILQQTSTKITILAGTNHKNFNKAPYIQSQTIFGTNSVSFDLNTNGDIDLSGDLDINGYKLPTDNISLQNNNKILSWSSQEDSMVFKELNISIDNEIGVTGSTINIVGNNVNVNDFDISFSDSRRSTFSIGDIKINESFENFGISEMLRRMVYRYLPPTSELRIIDQYQSGYAEFGSRPKPTLEFTINKKTIKTIKTVLTNMLPQSYPSITDGNYKTVTATASGIVVSPINEYGVTFSTIVSDGTQSNKSSLNIKGIYPYYYGFGPNDYINTQSLPQLSKIIEPMGDKEIVIEPGSGYLFFIYDTSYNDLQGGGSPFALNNGIQVPLYGVTASLSSINGFWVNKQFKVYRTDNITIDLATVYKFNHI